MSDARGELEGLWNRAEAKARQENAGAVELLEQLIDLIRSGFTNISNSNLGDDAERLRIQLLNVSAASLESGYAVVLRGYYQPALACARMVLEHLSQFLYFQKFPDQATRALNEDFQPPIVTGLQQHPNKAVSDSMIKAYDFLSKATHPRQASRLIGYVGGSYRISSYDGVLCRGTLGYLSDVGIRVAHVLGDEVARVGRNKAWEEHLAEVTRAWYGQYLKERERLQNESGEVRFDACSEEGRASPEPPDSASLA